MGIKDYHTFIKTSYELALIDPNKNNIYDCIYIDVNYVLHISIYGANNMATFVKNIYYHFDTIFSNFIATKKIFFAIDGTSSYAKIILQRERRSKGDNSNNGVSALGLSPGTKMMKYLEKKIELYINNLSNQYKFIKPDITISKSNVSDEGEIKICKQIINNGMDNLDYTHLIIGNDADIVVLSMGAKPIYNINILFNNSNTHELLSLKILLELFGKSLDKNPSMVVMANNNLRDDFVIVSLMMGNDYLPKMEFVNNLRLWDCYKEYYKQTKKTIINDGQLVVGNMVRFMHLIYTTMSKTHIDLVKCDMDIDGIKSYIDGLMWCLDVYNTGKCNDYGYAFTGLKPIHPFELYYYLVKNNNYEYNKKYCLPIDCGMYPLLIMPLTAKKLIPQKYYGIMDGELKYLYDNENCNECMGMKKIYLNTHRKIGETANVSLKENYKKTYLDQLNKFRDHKKTHLHKFGPTDISKIIELCKKI